MRKFMIVILSVLMLIVNIPIARASEVAYPQITLQQAIDKAIANSSTLRADSLIVDQAKDNRDAAAQAVTFVPAGPTTPQAEGSFNALQQADLNWQMAKRNYDADNDTVTIKVYQAYYGVLQAQAALEAAERQLQNIEWQRKIAAVSYRVGMLSNSQMLQTDASYNGAQSQLASAQKALNDAYEKFNLLVGLMPEERPALTDQPVFAPLVINSLDAEVSRVLDTSPTFWLLQKKVDLAKLALDLYSFGPAEHQTYKATELGVPIAEQNVASMQDQMTQMVRSLYYSIKQMEENYSGLQEKYAIDKENLRVAKIKYSAGVATEGEVIAAQVNLAQDAQNMTNLICQHQLLVKAFEKPWAYAASSSSSSSSTK
ncbi:TolC family protein [Moorella naiadis]|uniref:TolC family protein n=1 Tax=Moorella naiadis (nom. illeg.) TaxID=3093670 RepID=UPI003D9CA4B3